MALSPKINTRQAQKQVQGLTMTPQLQQAIKLLAMTNLELQEFVEEQLASNPLLERGTGTENRRNENEPQKTQEDIISEIDLSSPSEQAVEALDVSESILNEQASIAEQMPQSSGGEINWSKAVKSGSFSHSQDYDAGANMAAEKSLREVLSEQLGLEIKDEKERLIGAYLIDQLDENGYVYTDIEELADRLGVDNKQVLSVLQKLQKFEPTGVFARSLSECLALQLKEKNQLDETMRIILDNLELLARYDLKGLAKKAGIKQQELSDYIKRLKALNPKPGLVYGSDIASVIEPDVFVRERSDGGWAIELNSDTLPQVLVNSRYYAEVCNNSKDEQVKTYMSECAQNASWLVKSLDQRARTILKVASEIVKQQDEFFAYGVNYLRPLTLKTIAEAIDMHESTVSRVTSNKYLHTKRGIFEMKFFFTAAISSNDGQENHSSEAVRNKIKILISEEKQPKQVLSDDKIVKLLADQGIDIARRTVAKYRESLGFPSSVQRRRILKNR